LKKKAKEEEIAMARYAEEEAATGKATLEMAERIAARKRELAERKVKEEDEAMKRYAEEEAVAEASKAMASTIASRKKKKC
jgi:hypothetical protein